MDTATASKPQADDRFDTARITAEIDALAASHDGNGDLFRTAMAQLLKAEFITAREAAQAELLRDRHGRRCAERLCFIQDEIIRILYEAATRHLYNSPNHSSGERMAVVATGGYGRGLMAPESDIDLLFVLPYKQTAWGEQVAEAILYCLWDMGLKVGHATRSVDECIRQARADMTIRTAVLETRFLTGDAALYDELVERFDKEVVEGTAAEFVTAKLAEREERHRRSGQSRYLVEPNVKDGKGGLRDLHTLFWIAKYVYRARQAAELVNKGVFNSHEYRSFRRCEDFLWSVRCHIHFVAGRAEERLSFDMQREIAIRLGYTSHPGMQDVERFMKHYFLVAKQVGDLTAILCAKLEDQEAKPAPALTRMMARLRPSTKRRRLPGTDDFINDNNRINLAAPDVLRTDPVNLIRIFRLAQQNNLAFHPDAMRAVTHSLQFINTQVRENPEANRLFLEILTSDNSEIVLRRMNETGVLGRFIRAFGKIVAMMQFNMYHHYTVDEHLIRCVGFLQEIERGGSEEFVVASDLMRKIRPEHRAVLYISVLLHDIAKGQPEDHSVAGARVARRLCPRFGFNAADTELIAWLIEKHLTMSTVAQSRDLSDRKTIEKFAAVVESVEQMKLLDHPHHRRHPRRRPRRVERLEGAADPHAVLRDRAGADRRLLRGQSRRTDSRGAGGIPRRLHRNSRGRAQRLYLAALSGVLAQGRAAAQDPPRPLPARLRTGRPQAGDQCRLRRSARRHRTDHPGGRPSLAAVDHRRRLRLRRRQHRRRPDLHHHRRPRARHHRDHPRIRPRRGRGPPRHADRRHDRGGAGGQAAAAGSGGAARHQRQGQAEAVHGGAGSGDQQPVVGSLHRDRGHPGSTGRACCISSPPRSRSSTSTSPRPMSPPSANAPATCSTSPICSARRSPRRHGRPRSSAR